MTMPEKLIEEKFNVLGSQVEAAISLLEVDRAERIRAREADEARTEAEKQRSKWWRRLTTVAVVGSVLSILGLYITWGIVEQQRSDRAQAQVNSCRRYNDELAPAIHKIVDKQIEFIHLLAVDRDEPRTPEEQAQVDAIVAEAVADFEQARVLFRDCSPEGIEAFSEGTGGYLAPGQVP